MRKYIKEHCFRVCFPAAVRKAFSFFSLLGMSWGLVLFFIDEGTDGIIEKFKLCIFSCENVSLYWGLLALHWKIVFNSNGLHVNNEIKLFYVFWENLRAIDFEQDCLLCEF